MAHHQRDELVDAYIADCPADAQSKLTEMRALIRRVAPDAVERTDYFHLPGYSYAGFDYDGMFVWFSYKNSNVRLHVRPPTIDDHQAELSGFRKTKSIVDFRLKDKLPSALIKELVSYSIKLMKDK